MTFTHITLNEMHSKMVIGQGVSQDFVLTTSLLVVS